MFPNKAIDNELTKSYMTWINQKCGFENMEVKMIILLCDLLYDKAMFSTFCTVVMQHNIANHYMGIV